MYRSKSLCLICRFFSYLEEQPNGCINFTGALNGGYGRFYISAPRNFVYAHFFAFKLYYGHEPQYKLHHKCENKACCNPTHLMDIPWEEHMNIHGMPYIMTKK